MISIAKARTPLNTRDPYTGYAFFSIALHWLTAIAVIVLYVTHEADDFHVALGLVVSPLFLFRIVWRLGRGYPRVANQPALMNFLARLVQISFLLCILAVTVTGLLLPGMEGEPYPFFGGLSFGLSGSGDMADFAEEVHEVAGNAFIPLVILHVAGALKHHFYDRDAVLMRMLKPVPRGK